MTQIGVVQKGGSPNQSELLLGFRNALYSSGSQTTLPFGDQCRPAAAFLFPSFPGPLELSGSLNYLFVFRLIGSRHRHRLLLTFARFAKLQ